MEKTVNLLTEEDRAAIRESLLSCGAKGCKDKAKLAVYLAEQNAAYPLRVYGYLLQAAKRGFPVPQQLLNHYDRKTREMSKDDLLADYEGTYLVGCELEEPVEKIRMLCAAGSSDQDKFGVAALKAADQLSCSVRLMAQSTSYYNIAKMKHNPDIPCFERRSRTLLHE